LVVNKSSYLSGSTYISGDLHLSYPDNYDLSDTDVVNKQYLDDEHRLVEIIDHPDRSIIEDKIEYDEILYWSTLPIAGNWNSIAYGNDRFVAVGRGPTDKAAIGVMTRHGLKWQEVTMPNLSNWQSVTFGNGQFVAITDSRTVAYSSDGISWTETGMRVSASWQDIVWGNGIYVAIASNSHDKAAYSPDGTNWKESVLPTTPNNANWYSVAFGNGRFIAVAGDYLKGAASTDGINWTEVNMPIAAGWIDVSFGNGKFVALAHGNDNKAAYSSDGISWTETVLPNSANWQSVTFGDNGSFPGDKKFVAVAFSNDKFAFSKDGITWESGTLPANESWVSVTFGSREFVAISNSPNGPYYGMSVKFNDIIPDLFIKTKMIAEKNVTVPKLEDDLNLTEKYVRVETPPLPTITHTILQTYQTEHPSTDMDQAVNLEFVLKSLDNLYKEILNPSVPNGIVYIDGRADAGGKQTITATKDVPTPVI
jgi:hypothetical protein